MTKTQPHTNLEHILYKIHRTMISLCHVKVEKRPLFMSKCHIPNSKGLIFEVGELGGQWGTFALVLEFA
jgi:hypothetical protein